jgi:hypothetical protein
MNKHFYKRIMLFVGFEGTDVSPAAQQFQKIYLQSFDYVHCTDLSNIEEKIVHEIVFTNRLPAMIVFNGNSPNAMTIMSELFKQYPDLPMILIGTKIPELLDKLQRKKNKSLLYLPDDWDGIDHIVHISNALNQYV